MTTRENLYSSNRYVTAMKNSIAMPCALRINLISCARPSMRRD